MRSELLRERVEQLEKRIEGLEQVVVTRKKRAIGTPLEVVNVMVDKPVERTQADIEFTEHFSQAARQYGFEVSSQTDD